MRIKMVLISILYLYTLFLPLGQKCVFTQEIIWIKKADLPNPRWLGAAVVCNDKIYLIGGRGPDNRIIYEYNANTFS